MNIVTIASEVVPFAKTGGLADVAGTLPRSLSEAGHASAIIMPFYRRKTDAAAFGIRPVGKKVVVPFGDWKIEGEILATAAAPNVQVYFLAQPQFFDRHELYQTKDGDYPDNAERFAFFSRGAVEAMIALGIRPDIVHVHDWQSALVPLFLRTHYKDRKNFARTKTLLTIHNLGYQGLFPPDDMRLLGLGWEYFTFDKLEFWGKLGYLKAGIVSADAINTVSQKYAAEILTPEFGCGLEGALANRRGDLFGIMNGIDEAEWNPATDPFIAERFSPARMEGKGACKRALQQRFKLSEQPRAPLVGMIGRLTVQKGFDIVAEALPRLVEQGVQFAILGTGEKQYEEILAAAAAKSPEAVGLVLSYDNALAHQIEAGADLFLMPSRYEPCGLNQMISLKYGTIPIVRATGGLDDSIVDYDPKSGTGNGFKFSGIAPDDLVAAVGRAIGVYRGGTPDEWRRLVANALKADFSWTRSAKEYQDLYRRMLKG